MSAEKPRDDSRDHTREDATAEPVTDAATDRLLAALLAIDSRQAALIRSGTARPRPRPQVGPTAEHGD